MRRQDVMRYVLSLSLSVLCAGCIMYLPDAWTRSERENQVLAMIPSITPGQTTRQRVY